MSVEDTADVVIGLLHRKEIDLLTEFIHPEKGVRFTPYAYVQPEADLVFTPDTLPSLESSKSFHWGFFDGSGEPMDLTFQEYFNKFVYNHDFEQAELVTWNPNIQRGNSINNAQEKYPDAEIVEYHFSGFDPQYEGMDWASLRLAFEEYQGEWFLVGIIHDQWTI